MGLFDQERSIIAEALTKSSDKEALKKLVEEQRYSTGTRKFSSDAEAQKALQAEETMSKGHEARLEKASQVSALMDQIKIGIQNGKINSREDIIKLLDDESKKYAQYKTFNEVPDQSAESKSRYMLAKAADVLKAQLAVIDKIPFHPKESVPGIKDDLMNSGVEGLLAEIDAAKASGAITDVNSLNIWLTEAAAPLHDTEIQAIETTFHRNEDTSKLNQANLKTFLRARAAKLLLERVDYVKTEGDLTRAASSNPFDSNAKVDDVSKVIERLKASSRGVDIAVAGLPKGEDLTRLTAELAQKVSAYHVKEKELIENDKQGRLRNSVSSAVRFLAGLAPTEAPKTEKGAVTGNTTAATAEALKSPPAKKTETQKPSSGASGMGNDPSQGKRSPREEILATLDIAHLKPKFTSITIYLPGHKGDFIIYQDKDFINPAKLKEIASRLKHDRFVSAEVEFTCNNNNSYKAFWSESSRKFVYGKNTPEEDKIPLSPSNKLIQQSINIKQKDPKKSFELALQAVKTNPTNLSALILVANKYRDLVTEGENANKQKAVEYYRKALAINPTQEDAAYNIAIIHLNKENPTIDELIEAHKLLKIVENSKNEVIAETTSRYLANSFDADEIFNQGATLHKEGKHQLAAKYYQLALEVDPEFLKAALRLGEMYLSGKGVAKDLNTAKSFLTRAYNSKTDPGVSNRANELLTSGAFDTEAAD